MADNFLRKASPGRGATVALALLLALSAAFAGYVKLVGAQAGAAAPRQTAQVQRGDLVSSVGASGQVTATADLTLAFQQSGPVTEIDVAPGDKVAAGQVLARIDDTSLKLQVSQAQASLSSAQAKLEQVKEGATPKDLETAQAAVRSAQAKLDQTVKGTATQADLDNAQSALQAAQARLQQTLNGTTTPADLTSAQAALTSAQAKLEQVKQGTTTPQDLQSAQAKIDQARDAYAKTASSLSTAKTQAQLAWQQSASTVRDAQDKLNTAYWNWSKASSTGNDPITGKPINAAQVQQYLDSLNAAKHTEESAELAMSKAQASYDDAKNQEIAGLKTSQSQIDDAQAALAKLQQGPTTQDLAIAQSSVDQAQANLAKLQQGPTDQDVTIAQAAVDQAQANLKKLQQGGSAQDVTISRSSVDQALASLKDLQAGPKATDIAVAQAAVDQAQANLETAQASVGQAAITAPFAGTIAAVSLIVGQVAAPSTQAIALVNTDSMKIDVNVSEADIGKISLGQEAMLQVDAAPNQEITGKVTFVAPKAVITQNVVNYPVTVSVAGAGDVIKPGMTATVNLVTARKNNVLTLPVRAVHTVGQNRVVDVLYQGDVISSVPVQVGMTSDTQVEIVSGLQQGDTVVINSAPTNVANPTVRTPFGVGGGGGR